MAGENLSCFDLATVLGWCSGAPGSAPRFGSHRIAPPNAPLGEFLHRYALWLNDHIMVFAPAQVVYEAPIITGGNTSIDTAVKLISLAGLTDMICYRRGIRVWKADSSEVCKFFTGKGRYPAEGGRKGRDLKKAAVKEVCHRLGWKVGDDNAGDACALFSFAEFKLFPTKHRAHGGLFTPAAKVSA